MQGKKDKTDPERPLEERSEAVSEPDDSPQQSPDEESSSDSEKTLVLGETNWEMVENERMESEEEGVVERGQESEPSPTPSSRVPIENGDDDDDDDITPPLEPAASQAESETSSEKSVPTAIDEKTPSSPTWNEKFFETPEYSLKGMADKSDIREMCVSLMEFFASKHPHILKTLVLICTQALLICDVRRFFPIPFYV